MKTIIPFNNTPTIIHVNELPVFNKASLFFGFNPGFIGNKDSPLPNADNTPTVRVTVKLMNTGANGEQIKIATYESVYKIQGEGLVLEEHIYDCCQQAVYAMTMFLKYDQIGRSIPHELMVCPGKEAFEDDLIHLAKFLNATEGKRNFPTK